MDTKDQNQELELTSSGFMQPDTTMGPGLLEMSNGGTAAVTPEEGTVPPGQQEPKKSTTPLQDSLRRLRRDKRAMVSLGIIILFILIPIFGPVIYQHFGGIYNS